MKVKIGTQLPKGLHRRLKIAAARDGSGIDDIIGWALEDFLKNKRRGKSVYHRLCAIEDTLAAMAGRRR